MSKCGSCEHFNLHYYQDEHPSTKGKWGECVWPHKMNLDDISEIKKVKRVKKSIYDSCCSYMPQHCYGEW